MRRPVRLLLLASGMAALVAGIWTGLWRAGWHLPVYAVNLPNLHGPLMIAGFLGTLISLERAVALKRLWGFAAPVVTGLGAALMVAGIEHLISPILITAGSLILTIIFLALFRREVAWHYAVMGFGVNLWLIGNLLWLRGFGLPELVPWWMGFLVLTVAGERLELNRLLQLTGRPLSLFLSIIGLFILAAFVSLFYYGGGMRLVGFSLILLALWLLRYDMARRSLKQGGLSRYMGYTLLIGYGWLVLAGLLSVWKGGVVAGNYYDAILHAVFVGFIFSMIFGHAPVIFPALLQVPLAFRTAFYLPLILLHLSLLLRIGGDVFFMDAVRQ